MSASPSHPFEVPESPQQAAANPSRTASYTAGYRPDVDGLRALAIIPVVIFHAFPAIMPGGFVGVDIFFVISGFLISRIILQAMERGKFTFAGFYANRIRRIFPALLLVLGACFAFGWFFLLSDEYTRLGKHIVGAAGYVENFVLRREAGYFDIASDFKPLMHLWSLGIEEQFYLTYPLFLWAAWRFRRHLWAILLWVALISFSLNVWQVHRDSIGTFFLPQTRCWELMLGGILACVSVLSSESGSTTGIRRPSFFSLSQGRRFFAFRNTLSALGLLLIGFAIFKIHGTDAFPGWWALFPAIGAAFLIASGSDAWINRRVLSNKGMVAIGLISYPLYLWHWPVLTFPRILQGSQVSALARMAGVVISFALAWVTWRYVENPIRSGRKTWIKPVALALGSLVIASLGYAAYAGNGFIRRFPTLPADLGKLQHEVSFTADCQQMLGSAAITYCRSTAAQPPDVLLLGDSHAASLYAGLASGYKQRSHVLMNLGAPGCLPFYDTESYSPGEKDSNGCKPVINRILHFATSSATVHTIVLSLRGPLNMSGRDFAGADLGSFRKEILWDGAPKTSDQADIFTGALTETVSRLYASGETIVLFIDWPELDFDPRSCLPRPVTLFSKPRPLCGVPRTEVDARNRAYRNAIEGLRTKFRRLLVFDPLPYLCDSRACYALHDGHLLYEDDNHLSAAGAIYLSQKFFEKIPSQSRSLAVHAAEPH